MISVAWFPNQIKFQDFVLTMEGQILTFHIKN